MFEIIQIYGPTNNITFFGFNPCLNTCSRTIKKCCKGILSESNIRPYLSDVSISSFTISFDMLTKLRLSIITGSRAEKTKERKLPQLLMFLYWQPSTAVSYCSILLHTTDQKMSQFRPSYMQHIFQ